MECLEGVPLPLALEDGTGLEEGTGLGEVDGWSHSSD